MNTNDYELLDVKKSSSQTELNAIDVIITIRRNSDKKVITSTITKSFGYYNDLMAAIEQFQSGDVTMGAFAEIAVQAALSESEEAIVGMTQDDKMLSSHIALRNGHVYVDDKLINKVLEHHVLQIMRESKVDDNSRDKWVSLIHFVEKLYSNQSTYVRNQFYGWLDYQTQHGKITLTPDGNLIAYKGVKIVSDKDGVDRAYSINAGHGFVNGVEYHDSCLPNEVGNIVEIPREEVNSDPDVGCHIGLHVGTWDYASEFGRGSTLTVEVDPADIVSVPNDSGFQKIRVSKYKVIEVAVKPLDETIFSKTKKTANTSVPELFSTIEYKNADGVNDFVFTRENVKIDYDKEDENSIYFYDLESDHYYALRKYNTIFRGYNNQVIPQGTFSKSRSSKPKFEHDETKLATFVFPREYATLHYVSESGNVHDFEFDDIVIEDDDYVNVTIFSKNEDHYFTLHKTNITFLDDEGNEIDVTNGHSDENSDEENSEPANEVFIPLQLPGAYTHILYVTKSGEPREYFYQDVVSLSANNTTRKYLVELTSGEFRSLDAERTAFAEPHDTIDVDTTTGPLIVTDPVVRSQYNVDGKIVFVVIDTSDRVTLMTDTGKMIDISLVQYMNDFLN